MDYTAARHTIEVCQGPECREWGGPELLDSLEEQGCQVQAGHCQGLCHFAPIVHIGPECIAEATLPAILKKR